jgi:hypothetical protein
MPRWTIDSPTTLDFDGVAALRVRVISGSVAVLATADKPCLDVARVQGRPLCVTHEAGILTVSYEDLTWDGLLGWLRPQRHSAAITITVPRECPTQLGVVTASAIVSGIAAKTSIKSVSGDITLDGVTGSVDANTLSGDLEAQAIDGSLKFHSVSGDLTLAGGSVGLVDANTVSGRITADIDLEDAGDMHVATVSGEVAVRLPSQTDARIDLRSTTGKVQSGFDGLNCSRSPGSNAVTGTLGAGTGRLSVSTMSGHVTLLERNQRGAPPQAASDTGGGTVPEGTEGTGGEAR